MKFGARFAMPRRVTALEVQENGDFCAIVEMANASAPVQ